MSERRFPIQAVCTYHNILVTVPWSVAEEANKQRVAEHGNGETIEELAARHGFGAEEIALLLYRRIKALELGGPK